MDELGLCGPSELSEQFPRQRSRVARLPDKEDKLDIAPANQQRVVEDVVTQALVPEVSVASQALLALGLRPTIVKLIFSYLPYTRHHGAGEEATSSANLDLVFLAPPQAAQGPNHALTRLLEKAWAEHPDLCVRQVLRLGEWGRRWQRFAFFDAALWLWRRQPATLLANLHRIPEVGCWNDLNEILVRVCEGEAMSRARDREKLYRRTLALGKKPPSANLNIGGALSQAKRALRCCDEDTLYRALYKRVAELFAEQLRADLLLLQGGSSRPSFCAKWCPGLDTSIDRRTLLCEGIARTFFPRSEHPEYADLGERHYAFRVRDRLRREVLVPLKAFFHGAAQAASAQSTNAPRAPAAIPLFRPPPGFEEVAGTAKAPPGLEDVTALPKAVPHQQRAVPRPQLRNTKGFAPEGHNCSRSFRFLEHIRKRRAAHKPAPGKKGQRFRRRNDALPDFNREVEAVMAILQWARNAVPRGSPSGSTLVAVCSRQSMHQKCAADLCCSTVATAVALLLGESGGVFHRETAFFPASPYIKFIAGDDGDHTTGRRRRVRGYVHFSRRSLSRHDRILPWSSDSEVSHRWIARRVLESFHLFEPHHEQVFAEDLKGLLESMLETYEATTSEWEAPPPPPRRLLLIGDYDHADHEEEGSKEVTNHLMTVQDRYASKGLPFPEVIIWDLVGRPGAPAIAHAPGRVLVSGFSLALLDEVLCSGWRDGPWAPAVAVQSALAPYSTVQATRSLKESEATVRKFLGEEERGISFGAPNRGALAVPRPLRPRAPFRASVPDSDKAADVCIMRVSFTDTGRVSPHMADARKSYITTNKECCKVQDFDYFHTRSFSFPKSDFVRALDTSVTAALALKWQATKRLLVLVVDEQAMTAARGEVEHWMGRTQRRLLALRIQMLVAPIGVRNQSLRRLAELQEHGGDWPMAWAFYDSASWINNATMTSVLRRRIAALNAHPEELPKDVRRSRSGLGLMCRAEKRLNGCDEVGMVLANNGRFLKKLAFDVKTALNACLKDPVSVAEVVKKMGEGSDGEMKFVKREKRKSAISAIRKVWADVEDVDTGRNQHGDIVVFAKGRFKPMMIRRLRKVMEKEVSESVRNFIMVTKKRVKVIEDHSADDIGSMMYDEFKGGIERNRQKAEAAEFRKKVEKDRRERRKPRTLKGKELPGWRRQTRDRGEKSAGSGRLDASAEAAEVRAMGESEEDELTSSEDSSEAKFVRAPNCVGAWLPPSLRDAPQRDGEQGNRT